MQTNTGLHEARDGTDREETVEIVRGDDALRELGIENVVGIKIDVEGHEPDVVRGLVSTLETKHPIVFWEAFNASDAKLTVDLLAGLGYRNFSHLGRLTRERKLLGSITSILKPPLRRQGISEDTIFSGLNIATP